MKQIYLFAIACLMIAFMGCEPEMVDDNYNLEFARVAVVSHDCGLALQADDNTMMFDRVYPAGLSLELGNVMEIGFVKVDKYAETRAIRNSSAGSCGNGSHGDSSSRVAEPTCFDNAGMQKVNIHEFDVVSKASKTL